MDSDIKLKLLFGKPINIGICKIYPLTIEEIVEMGEQLYNQYLGILLYDVDLLDINKKMLEEMQIDKFTTYHFLLMQSYKDEEFKNLVIKAFECFIKEDIYYDDKSFTFYLLKENNTIAYPITFEIYELFKKILIRQNFLEELEEEEELIFGNEIAKKWYLDMKKKEKNKPKPKGNVDLQSIISAVKWHSKKSKQEILDMTIYELWDGYYRLSVIDNCNNLAQGIYHGTIDAKKIKDNELNWGKIIKFDKNN